MVQINGCSCCLAVRMTTKTGLTGQLRPPVWVAHLLCTTNPSSHKAGRIRRVPSVDVANWYSGLTEWIECLELNGSQVLAKITLHYLPRWVDPCLWPFFYIFFIWPALIHRNFTKPQVELNLCANLTDLIPSLMEILHHSTTAVFLHLFRDVWH